MPCPRCTLLLAAICTFAGAALTRADELSVLADVPQSQREAMLWTDVRARLKAANARDLASWRAIGSLADWEARRTASLAALRRSLGDFPPPPADLHVEVTRTHAGEGYAVENIVFQSRDELFVTAHLYRPAPERDSMPGVIIIHSHHNPKSQSELQDMGVMWARAGCVVLVMDQLGHGERRQHPFVTAADYAAEFRPSRQDYYFRYNLAVQLQLLGDSLMGWMVYDIHRGVDLLLQQPGIDARRVVLLGSVAGGGDPCAVAAALDERIACAVPFNFGGPQPETTLPLPEDAEAAFNYAGGGSWESTRNLAGSVAGGFFPWTIVGATAPRRLIYAHEFRWDQQRDPVWKRLQTIFGYYDAADGLAYTHGYGELRQSSQEASHCNNIGQPHRKLIHEALNRWFEIPVPDETYRDRRPPSEMICLRDGRQLKPLHELLFKLAQARRAAARSKLDGLPAAERLEKTAVAWRERLGNIEPYAAKLEAAGPIKWRGHDGEKLALTGDGQVVVPAILLRAAERRDKQPLVFVVGQQGKASVLASRPDVVQKLLTGGVDVCLVDVRGTGETAPGNGRGRTSSATSLASSEMMLGQTLLGSQIRDVRTLVAALRATYPEYVDSPLAMWGTSASKPHVERSEVASPHGISAEPRVGEPLGQLLALLTALYEPSVQTIAAEGGLAGYQSVLTSQFCHVPYDAVVSGAIALGDLDLVAACLGPRIVWQSDMVNGENRQDPSRTREFLASIEKISGQASSADKNTDLAECLVDRLGK